MFRPLKLAPALVAAGSLAILTVGCVPRALVVRALGSAPGCLFYRDTDAPSVALTIDDGPGTATGEILDVLARHRARATFFLISSRVAGREEAVRRIVSEGHELGNHFTRDEPSIGLEDGELQAAVKTAHAVLAGFGPLRWIRPGGGRYNGEMVSVWG